MTEFVVTTLLNFVFDKVASCIGSSLGVHEELKKLQSTFLTIQAVLEDAEARQVKEKSLKVWLRKLKDVAYDIDDLLDRVVDEDREIESSKIKRARRFLNSFPFRSELARSIKEIKERLDEIAKERSQFDLQERVVVKEEIGVVREETGSFVNESEVYGREEDREKIVEFLINNRSSPSGDDLGVMAIVGLGGLGKTTVAQLVYNDERVGMHFEIRMWVCVSYDSNTKKICRSIIESVRRTECSLRDMDSLQRSVIEELRGKRFLLVLDDVWNENHINWNRLQSLLSFGAKGSKILVTTRIENVAYIMGTVPPHSLAVLSEDDCWTLFEKRAFGLGGANKTPNLVAIGREIVNKCGGVPLAATALGSLMRFKKWESEWLTVKDSELWELPDDENEILPALMLSYNHLPSRLKQCFAYCSIFPKDYQIEKETLVQLWIAEGFIRSSDENANLGDMGFKYVDELLSRSLLQFGTKDYNGVLKSVKMHDLVHDLARSVAGEECSIVDASTGKGFFESSRYSSFLFSEDISAILEPLNLSKKLRTFHLITSEAMTKEEEIQKLLYVIFSELKLLRALHLSRCPIKGLPGSVGNLEHLRYLDLTGAHFETLSSCIGILHNLQTLILKYCRGLLSLPDSIGDLHNLLTLDLGYCNGLLSLPSSIGRLTSLQKLNLKSCNSLQALPESIGDLHNLLTLDLGYCVGLLSLPSSIGRLTSLRKLNLGILSLPSSMGRLTSLRKFYLKLCMYLQVLPESIGDLHNLLTLDLGHCKGLLSLPSSIGRLTSLRKLNLTWCTSLQTLPESVSSLRTLQELDLECCTKLVQLPENLSNMRSLLHLNNRGCWSLTCLPAGLGQLSDLRRLPRYVLGKENQCSLGELGSLNHLQGKLEIYDLENVRNVAEARSANLRKKHSLRILQLKWNSNAMQDRDGYVVDEDVLESLQPHTNLQELYIHGYLGRKFPSWMLESSLPSLVDIDLSSCFRCERLPPFGQLPKLKILRLSKLPAVKCLGSDFYGGIGAFRLLEKLTLNSMPALEEWSGATATANGGEIFPSLFWLSITDCPKLKALPSTFPFVTDLWINADQGLLLSPLQDGAFSILRCLRLFDNNFGSFSDLPQVIKERMASINNWTDAHLTQLNSITLGSFVSSDQFQLN